MNRNPPGIKRANTSLYSVHWRDRESITNAKCPSVGTVNRYSRIALPGGDIVVAFFSLLNTTPPSVSSFQPGPNSPEYVFDASITTQSNGCETGRSIKDTGVADGRTFPPDCACASLRRRGIGVGDDDSETKGDVEGGVEAVLEGLDEPVVLADVDGLFEIEELAELVEVAEAVNDGELVEAAKFDPVEDGDAISIVGSGAFSTTGI